MVAKPMALLASHRGLDGLAHTAAGALACVKTPVGAHYGDFLATMAIRSPRGESAAGARAG